MHTFVSEESKEQTTCVECCAVSLQNIIVMDCRKYNKPDVALQRRINHQDFEDATSVDCRSC